MRRVPPEIFRGRVILQLRDPVRDYHVAGFPIQALGGEHRQVAFWFFKSAP